LKRTFFSIFILIGIASPAFSQSWIWAQSATGPSSYSEGRSVATDPTGNVYVAGYFDSPTLSFGTNTLTNARGDDAFLAKYSSSGSLLWVKSAGGSDDDEGLSVTTDASGNVYFVGHYESAHITFGSFVLPNPGLVTRIFIVKYDGAGNVLWATSPVGSGSYNYCSVATNTSGDFYVSGGFNSPNITFGTYSLFNSGSDNIFIAKYDGNGNAIWAKSVGGSGSDNSLCIASDSFGDAIVTGNFNSPTVTFGTDTLTNPGGHNFFIAKFDGTGNVLWAKNAGGVGSAAGFSVTADALGNSYVTGSFNSTTITFGPYTLTNTGVGTSDLFFAKYDGAGNVIWVKNAGGAGQDYGSSVSLDASGNAYLTGGFNSPSFTFGTNTLPFPTGGVDPMFIAKCDSTGLVLCITLLPSGGEDNSAIATDAFGNAYVVSDFQTSSLILGNTTLTLRGTGNVFVARFNACAISDTCHEIFIPNFFSPNNDGMNEYECIYGQNCIKTFHFTIFDRWGEKVFETSNSNECWDGTYHGQPMSSAGFVYFFSATLVDGEQIQKKGNITLMR